MIKNILNFSFVYDLFSKLITNKKGTNYDEYIKKYLKPFSSCKILDIGCGTATILRSLGKDVNYFGLDFNANYIAHATENFSEYPNAIFVCEDVDNYFSSDESFDIIMLNGVMHHLTDDQINELLTKLCSKLSVHGHFCSFDGVYINKQRWMSRFLLKNDRGEFVRTKEQYDDLVLKHFPNAKCEIVHDWLRLPYDLIVYF